MDSSDNSQNIFYMYKLVPCSTLNDPDVVFVSTNKPDVNSTQVNSDVVVMDPITYIPPENIEDKMNELANEYGTKGKKNLVALREKCKSFGFTRQQILQTEKLRQKVLAIKRSKIKNPIEDAPYWSFEPKKSKGRTKKEKAKISILLSNFNVAMERGNLEDAELMLTQLDFVNMDSCNSYYKAIQDAHRRFEIARNNMLTLSIPNNITEEM